MDELRRAYRTTVVIGLAMMASLVVYLVVVSLIEDGILLLHGVAELQGNVPELLKFLFLGVSLVLVLLVRPVTRTVLKTRDGTEVAHFARSPAGPLATAAVITFALCEVPAILGLVLYVLARNASDFYLFLIISLFAFSIHFPRFGHWEDWYRQRRGQR